MNNIQLFNTIFSMKVFPEEECLEAFMNYSIKKGDLGLIKNITIIKKETYSSYDHEKVCLYEWIELARDHKQDDVLDYFLLELCKIIKY